VDREGRILTADRNNDRIEVFSATGEFIEEWPNVVDPVGVYIDEREGVWVISAAQNRILKFDLQGVLQYGFGAYGGTLGGFPGGLARPHQLSVDSEGNVYVASYDGPWLNKFTPKPGADPNKLIGQPLVLR
jgi:streptogramin lyase